MAVDFTLKIDGIDGESMIQDHTDEIDILSFSWGATQMGAFGTGGGGGAGKVNIQDISFTKFVDKASAPLFGHCCNGKHIPEATLSLRKAGENPLDYLTITMSDLLVSSWQTGGSNGTDVITETISLNFGKVKFKYTVQNKDGTKGDEKEWTWDVKANTGG
jgi:type VI secretion system secreted protein Hcp